jgi:post-segregation antitoxin (ccd killing protein)
MPAARPQGVRRQINLDEADDRLLEEPSKATGISISELVHRAIQQCRGAGRRLTWAEGNAHTIKARSATEDAWTYDPLFDGDIDKLIGQQIDEADRQRAHATT